MKEKDEYLGRPAQEVLAGLSPDEKPEIKLTAAPGRNGETRQDGTLRLIQCREGQWIAARFLDGMPKRKKE